MLQKQKVDFGEYIESEYITLYNDCIKRYNMI